jgi:hypothetical protein
MRPRNPLRKKSLDPNINNLEYSKWFKSEWLNNIKNDKDSEIFQQYEIFKKRFPERAEKWLEQISNKKANEFLRTKLPESVIKICDVQGIRIFTDSLITKDFTKNSRNDIIIQRTINILLTRIRGILPNRKPKIVITNKSTNPLFTGLKYADSAVALYYDRIIYVDENEIDDPDIFIHEFSHFVVDLIPKQTEKMLDDAYNKMLDLYWKRAKVKKINLEQTEIKDTKSVMETKKWRERISKKLGFPQYGLINSSEFFAVLIENWDKLPNNSITYNYKQLVKNILTRI